MQTGKTTPIRRAAVRDTSVSGHHEGLLKPLGPSQQYRIEGFEVSPQWDPIMLREKYIHMRTRYIFFSALSQLRICRPPPPPTFDPVFYGWCAMCWNEWKINFPILIFRVIMKNSSKIGVFKHIKYFWKKLNFRFFRILFFELWSFIIIFVPNFRWTFHYNSKSKNRKLIFHSFQHIAHHT